MHIGEAMGYVSSLSFPEIRQVLTDHLGDVILREAAALVIATRGDLAVDERVCCLFEGWESAPLDLKRNILQALAYCPSPRSTAFIKEKLSDQDLRSAALRSLANLGDASIMPVCKQIIQSGTECECRNALSALVTLDTSSARALVEAAVQSAPSESVRERAAYLLALKGKSTGEAVLERKLSHLQPLRVESDESEAQDKLGVNIDYFLTAVALTEIKNKRGLQALKQVLDILQTNEKVDRHSAMTMTHAIVGMPTTTNFEDWKVAMKNWIEERLKAQSEN